MDAWLEDAHGVSTPIKGTLSLGRSSKNQLKLDHQEASRHHALIHNQGIGEFWLVDLGSTNGTLHRGRRIWQPVPLAEGDVVEICGRRFTFHRHAESSAPKPATGAGAPTLRAAPKIRKHKVWLLLADIEGSSALSQQLSTEAFAMLVGGWFRSCKDAIELHSGAINKYLGDGFLAHWAPDLESPDGVLAAMADLSLLRESQAPKFRIVLHFGEIAMIDDLMLGEDSMAGADLHFLFRMEKVAGSSKWPVTISKAASDRIKARRSVKLLGETKVPDSKGTHLFFALG